jgi:predicted ATPase
VNAVSAALQVSARAGRSLEESLVEFLRAKRLLLVLDNAEHLLDPVAALAELLERTCSELLVLVTSREGLGLAGEQVLPVPSLAAPPLGTPTEAAVAVDAVRLFVERAQAADPDFALAEANTPAVVEVCRRLDGLPLAIEVAAARVSMMTPTELARGLDRRFAILTGGRRRAVPRHQTLRAAIDWSYELLTGAEQRLLARLAVFVGGWSRSAAEVVCGKPPLPSELVFDALAGLVAKSLVVAQRDGTETRYRLLETISEYTEERLADLGETDLVRAAHADYFCASAGRLRDQLFGSEQVTVARHLVADYDNLLAAMHHALDTEDVDLALRMASHWPPPYLQVGHRLVLPVEVALELPGAEDHPLYASGLVLAATWPDFEETWIGPTLGRRRHWRRSYGEATTRSSRPAWPSPAPPWPLPVGRLPRPNCCSWKAHSSPCLATPSVLRMRPASCCPARQWPESWPATPGVPSRSPLRRSHSPGAVAPPPRLPAPWRPSPTPILPGAMRRSTKV